MKKQDRSIPTDIEKKPMFAKGRGRGGRVKKMPKYLQVFSCLFPRRTEET